MKEDKILRYIEKNTDKYFSKTKKIVLKYGDKKVVYAFFVRKPTIYSCKLAILWIKETCKELDYKIDIYENFQEGDKVPAGEPLFFLEGYFSQLSELETLILQRIGIACSCAWNAYMMSSSLPRVSFISMLARHCPSSETVYLAEYGVSVGSKKAQEEESLGFIGCSTDNSKDFFGLQEALGTMPHSLIGYAKSTLEAAKKYYDTLKPSTMTVLVDYFGKEITDTLEVCSYFSKLANEGKLAIRLDTHGKRYLEGLDYNKSNEIIEKYAKEAFYAYKDKKDLTYLLGTGVSAAAIFYIRKILDENGFNNVKIVASSGFDIKKCNLMAKVNAPIDIIGTGSLFPEKFSDTYAIADIISYDNDLSVKQGRDYLIKRWQKKIS